MVRARERNSLLIVAAFSLSDSLQTGQQTQSSIPMYHATPATGCMNAPTFWCQHAAS
jgi:hypothetical protein